MPQAPTRPEPMIDEPHPTREGVLKATWQLSGLEPSSATGMRARVGSINAECVVEVLGSEADRYRNVIDLGFERDRYRLKLGAGPKKVRLLAPTRMVREPMGIEVSIENSRFKITGERTLWL